VIEFCDLNYRRRRTFPYVICLQLHIPAARDVTLFLCLSAMKESRNICTHRHVKDVGKISFNIFIGRLRCTLLLFYRDTFHCRKCRHISPLKCGKVFRLVVGLLFVICTAIMGKKFPSCLCESQVSFLPVTGLSLAVFC
jgi:hypothetical protein